MTVNASDLTAYAHFTKRLYIDKNGVENVANHAHPLWDMVDHSTEDTWEGDGNAGWSVAWGRNQAVGANYTTVSGNIDNNKGDRFNFDTRTFVYGFARLTGEVIKATRSNVGSIEKAVKDTNNQTIQTIKDRLALWLYGDGSGVIGRRSSLNTNTITLASADDAKNFQKGQYLQFSATQTGGSIKTGQCQVTKVTYGRTSSTITVDDISLISGHANDDYIYNASDYDAVPTGLGGWIPTSDPSASDSFFGVNRSSDNLRLAGHRLDGTGYASVKEVAQDLANGMGRLSASRGEKAGMVHPTVFGELEKQLETKAVRDPSNKATFGYRFIEQTSTCGDIRWYPDPDCPTHRMWILDPSDIFILSLGRAPHVMDEDGMTLRKVSGADTWQTEWRFMGEFGVRNPVKHGVATL